MPLFLQKVQGVSALDTGLILLPSTLLMAAISPLVGKLFDRFDPRWLVAPGLLFLTFSTWMLGRLTTETSHGYVMFWMCFRYIGIGLAMTPVSNIGMIAVPRAWAGHASAITNWVRQGLGALSIGLFSSIATYRAAVHGAALAREGTVPQAMLAQTALTGGINDVFFIATVIGLVAVLASFVLAKPKEAPQEPGQTQDAPAASSAEVAAEAP